MIKGEINMVKDLCFEIIEKCLNECMFCSSNSNCNKKQIITFENFKKVIDHFMSTGGIQELSLSGGEPFLHPQLIEMVKYTKSLHIKTVIFTSGVTKKNKLNNAAQKYYLKEFNNAIKEVQQNEPDNQFLLEKIRTYYNNLLNPTEIGGISKEVLNTLNDIGLDKIVFDVQAYEAETDHKIMGRKEPSRQALLDSIIRASQTNINIDIHFIPTKLNYKEIPDILELLEIAKIQNISILNFLPQGRGRINKKELLLSEKEKNEFFTILEQSKKYYTGNIRIGTPFFDEQTHQCNAGLEKLDIKFDGTVLPCPAFKELTKEECEKFNIKLPNIYSNLEEIKIKGEGKRAYQLCKQVYKNRKK